MWGRTWDGGQITLSYSWFDIAPTHGNFNSKFTYDHRPWGFDDRRPIGSSMPGTISTGNQVGLSCRIRAIRVRIPNPNYPGNLGTNCQNCYAIPRGTGFDWDPGTSGIGPTGAADSAPTLNWADLNTPDNSGTNGTRNVFNPYSITYYSAAIQYTGGAITVDQRLTSNISFYGEGVLGHAPRAVHQQRHRPPARLSRSRPSIPIIPTGAPNESARRLPHGHRSGRSHHQRAYAMAISAIRSGLNIALPADWAMQVYYLAHQGHGVLQQHERRREQSRGVRGPGLDDAGNRTRSARHPRSPPGPSPPTFPT